VPFSEFEEKILSGIESYRDLFIRWKKKMAQGIRTYTASRYIRVANFNKLTAEEK